ncbi:MAG: hypothetical protein PVH07_09185 [Chloroflexota bacterium]|jgi:hypothetical protein
MRTLRLHLAGMVFLALLGGLSGAVLAQEGATELTTPAFFELIEETGDDEVWGIVTTDPRFSGTWVSNDPDIRPIGHGYDHVSSGSVHLQNDEGDWKGWTGGFSWMQGAPWHEQMWLVGEGEYEGLSAVVASRCEQLPCEEGDTCFYGIIYEGNVPPLGPSAE